MIQVIIIRHERVRALQYLLTMVLSSQEVFMGVMIHYYLCSLHTSAVGFQLSLGPPREQGYVKTLWFLL